MLFKVEVEVAPSVIAFPSPLTAMAAVGAIVVVAPVVTPPGLTQLEVVPVSAKLARVPFLPFPLASIKVVTVLFAKDAAP